jgi:hypothetical protein
MLGVVVVCRQYLVHSKQAWETAMKINFTNSANTLGLNGHGLDSEGNWL